MHSPAVGLDDAEGPLRLHAGRRTRKPLRFSAARAGVESSQLASGEVCVPAVVGDPVVERSLRRTPPPASPQTAGVTPSTDARAAPPTCAGVDAQQRERLRPGHRRESRDRPRTRTNRPSPVPGRTSRPRRASDDAPGRDRDEAARARARRPRGCCARDELVRGHLGRCPGRRREPPRARGAARSARARTTSLQPTTPPRPTAPRAFAPITTTRRRRRRALAASSFSSSCRRSSAAAIVSRRCARAPGGGPPSTERARSTSSRPVGGGAGGFGTDLSERHGRPAGKSAARTPTIRPVLGPRASASHACPPRGRGVASRAPAARRAPGPRQRGRCLGPPDGSGATSARADYAGSAACARCHAGRRGRVGPLAHAPDDARRRAAPRSARRSTGRAGPSRTTRSSSSSTAATASSASSRRRGGRRRTYRVTRVIGGRTREDFAGVDVAGGGEEVVLPGLVRLRDARPPLQGLLGHGPRARDACAPGPVWSRTCIFCHNTVPEMDRLLGALAGPRRARVPGRAGRPLAARRPARARARDRRRGASSGVVGEEIARLGGGAAARATDARAVARRRASTSCARASTATALVEEGIGCEACHGGVARARARPARPPLASPRPRRGSRCASAGRPRRRPSTARARAATRSSSRATRSPGRAAAATPTAGGSHINSGEARDFLLGGCASAMACTACHDPHGARRPGALRRARHPRRQRHLHGVPRRARRAPSACAPTPTTTRPAPAASCVACHMPRKNMGLDGTLTRYHRIGSPTDPARVLGDRPLECALCHADATVRHLVDAMEAWWPVRYPRQRLEELYGSLDANVMRATLERGKAHEQAVAIGDARARRRAPDAAPLIAPQLGNEYPLVREWARRALDGARRTRPPHAPPPPAPPGRRRGPGGLSLRPGAGRVLHLAAFADAPGRRPPPRALRAEARRPRPDGGRDGRRLPPPLPQARRHRRDDRVRQRRGAAARLPQRPAQDPARRRRRAHRHPDLRRRTPSASPRPRASPRAPSPLFIDINCGCWVPKIAGRGAGAGWLRDPAAMVAMARMVVESVSLPVTVKTRIGLGPESHMPIVDLARRLEDAGVAAITHPLPHRADGALGRRRLVVGRAGARRSSASRCSSTATCGAAQDARRAIDETGCAGVMVGRRAIEHPWIFREARALLDRGVEIAAADARGAHRALPRAPRRQRRAARRALRRPLHAPAPRRLPQGPARRRGAPAAAQPVRLARGVPGHPRPRRCPAPTWRPRPVTARLPGHVLVLGHAERTLDRRRGASRQDERPRPRAARLHEPRARRRRGRAAPRAPRPGSCVRIAAPSPVDTRHGSAGRGASNAKRPSPRPTSSSPPTPRTRPRRRSPRPG